MLTIPSIEKNSRKNPHPKLEGRSLILFRKKLKPHIKSIKGIKYLPIPKEVAKKLYKDSAKLYLTSVKLHHRSKKTLKYHLRHKTAATKEAAKVFLDKHKGFFKEADKFKKDYTKLLEKIHKNLKAVESELKKAKL